MFSSTLRHHSPSIARISFISIRSLTSYTPTRTIVRNSLKNPPAASSQHRFFSVSPFLKNDTEAEQEFVEESAADPDPPAGEYIHHTGDPGVTHHYGKDEPITRFQQLADRGLVDPVIIDKIVKGKGYEEMTKVQRKTILETLGGDDVFGQAKTGTGKTFAFLLPVIQRIRSTTIPLKPRRRIDFRTRNGETNADVRAIIISPTRELAQQIKVDAQFLTQNTEIVTQLAVGGSGKRESLASIRSVGCHILVATPGRLHDLLSDPQAGISTKNLETLVLDEADHLLDQGFAEAIDDIIKLLPNRDAPVGNTGKFRQTLLFSATIPDKVQKMARKTMRHGHKFLQMVEKGEAATHEKVPQHIVRCKGLENQLPALVELLKREIETVDNSVGTEKPLQPFKAIIFFTAVRPVMLFSTALQNLNLGDKEEGRSINPFYPAKIFEMHSRLTQYQRTRTAENFRRARSGILLSSDITARGMDFPGVTHVIQMGAPKNEETYIHRIGRTARGDRSGVGYLFLSGMEYPDAMSELRKLPLKLNNSLVTAGIDLGVEQELPKHAAEILMSVTEANQKIDPYAMKDTYMSLIGCYGGIKKPVLAESLNRLATLGWGLPSPPEVSRVLASKLGIGSHHGFHVSTSTRGEADSEESDRPSRGGGGGRGGRGGFSGRGGRGGFSDRPSYRSSGGEEGGGYERKPFRPRDDNNGSGYERKPFRPQENGDSEGDGGYERKPFRPRDSNNGASYERKPFHSRDDSSGGYERKPFRPRNDDDDEGGSGNYERRPYRSRSDDDDGEGGGGGYGRGSFAPRGSRGRGRGRGGYGGRSSRGSGGERGRGGYQRARNSGPGNWERGNRGRSSGGGRY
ncbi:P-loop containing nucleoside triphosphate hydrolase protein [Tuber indicum]|nr:P-loop containing nucleoside triphosphate hydrolase protein [Tuber indicum]